LGGNRKGQYSIRINAQWRLCFGWECRRPLAAKDDMMFAEGDAVDAESAGVARSAPTRRCGWGGFSG